MSDSDSNTILSTGQRDLVWAQLDRKPEHSEIASYAAEEIAEFRRLSNDELENISRLSGSGTGLNKETQSFLDAMTVVRALSHVAEQRFEQGKLDGAATSAINALRWDQLADGLYLSGGVSAPRTDPTRLWYLLAEIYVRMDERDLALRTIQKASASYSAAPSPPLRELISVTNGPADTSESVPAAGGVGRIVSSRRFLRSLANRPLLLFVAILITGVIAFVTIRAQVSVKSMIDNSSIGVDFLNIAFDPRRSGNQDDELLLASDRFSALSAQLDSWSWITTMSAIAPPIHDQFVGLKRIAALGTQLSHAPAHSNGGGRFSRTGSIDNVCLAAERLREFDGNLLGQLEKNRSQMLGHVPVATANACQ